MFVAHFTFMKKVFSNELISLEDYCQVTERDRECKIIFIYRKAKDAG